MKKIRKEWIKEEYKQFINFLYNEYETSWFMYDLQNMDELHTIEIIHRLIDDGIQPLFYTTEWIDGSYSFQNTKQLFFFDFEDSTAHGRWARDYSIVGAKFNVLVNENVLQVIGRDLEKLMIQYKRAQKINDILD